MSTELIRLLEQEARTEADAVGAEVQTRAEEILSAAKREAEEIVASARKIAEQERTQARARSTSTASLRAAAVVLAAKDAAIRDVFERADAALSAAMRDPGKRAGVLRALLAEAARGAASGGGRLTVEVPAADVTAVGEACRQLGLDADVREGQELRDGLRLLSADGRSVVENTVPSRLARARREMVSKVAEILWGTHG